MHYGIKYQTLTSISVRKNIRFSTPQLKTVEEIEQILVQKHQFYSLCKKYLSNEQNVFKKYITFKKFSDCKTDYKFSLNEQNLGTI